MILSVALLALLAPQASTLSAPAGAQEPTPSWPQFRGPGGLGVASDTPIPSEFGPDERVLWKTALPPGHSSPCIDGDRIFLTGRVAERDVVVALDRTSGALVWQRSFVGEPDPDYAHVDAVPALPTPCTDGERVYVYFGGYGLVALDAEGQVAWEQRLPHPGYGFGVGTSPILAGGRVILARDGAPEAAILAFDAEDGSEAWRIDRFDFMEAHATPFLWRNADREELVVAGTGRVCSFDPKNGAPLWQVGGVTLFTCTTPTADADTLYFAGWSTPNSSGRSFWEAGFGRSLDISDEELADTSLFFKRLDANGDGHVQYEEIPACRAKDAFTFIDRNENGTWEPEELLGRGDAPQAPGKNVLVAIARGGEGDVSESHVRWRWTRGLPYVASPLLYRGRIWLFKSGGFVSCVDAETGKRILDRERLSDKAEYYVSPVGAAGKVLAGSAAGTLFVLDAGTDELSVLHSVDLGEKLFATPAVLDGVVYVRTESTLWAFGS